MYEDATSSIPTDYSIFFKETRLFFDTDCDDN